MQSTSSYQSVKRGPDQVIAPLDYELLSPPEDSISSLAWSPASDLLAVSSWDNTVRVYEVVSGGPALFNQSSPPTITGKAAFTDHPAPVLSVCWSKDGTKLFTGGADCTARMYDIATQQYVLVAQHAAPIAEMRFFVMPQGPGILVTGSWDETVKYWDTSRITGQPLVTLTLPAKVYSLDIRYPLLAIGTSETPLEQPISLWEPTTRHIHFIDLASPQNWGRVQRTVKPSCKGQTRSVVCFGRDNEPQRGGCAVGDDQGKIGIQYLNYDEQDQARARRDNIQDFSFRCAWVPKWPTEPKAGVAQLSAAAYPINAIAFHPTGTFATGGSDGRIIFWDKDNRVRLNAIPQQPPATAPLQLSPPPWAGFGQPVTALAYSRNGDWLAYALSYDWAGGHSHALPGRTNRVFVRRTVAEDLRKIGGK